mgnify:CR=1 FL=1
MADYVIDSISGGTRAEYVAVSAARNAICIAWITVAMFDGTTGGAWTGDVGHYCGQSWYPQHEKAGWLDDKKTKPYIPKCTWIDRDHSSKIKGAALKFSVSGYGDDVVKTVKNAKVCKLSIFGADSGPISSTSNSLVFSANTIRCTDVSAQRGQRSERPLANAFHGWRTPWWCRTSRSTETSQV